MKTIKFLRNVIRTYSIMQEFEREMNREMTEAESNAMMNFAVFTELTNDEIVKELKEMNAK